MTGRPAEQNTGPVGVPDRRFVGDLFHALAPRYNGVLLAYTFGQDLRWKYVLLRRLHPERGERALDLACGTGLIVGRLTRILGESGVVGLDINRSMLLEMDREGPSHRIVQADAEHLPFASRSFDLVTAGYLLKYVHLDRFLGEVGRILPPGGRFAGYDFSRPVRGTPSGSLYSVYLHRILPWIGRSEGSSPDSWRSVFKFLSRVAESSGWENGVRTSLGSAGFENVEMVPSLGGAITWVWAQTPR